MSNSDYKKIEIECYKKTRKRLYNNIINYINNGWNILENDFGLYYFENFVCVEKKGKILGWTKVCNGDNKITYVVVYKDIDNYFDTLHINLEIKKIDNFVFVESEDD